MARRPVLGRLRGRSGSSPPSPATPGDARTVPAPPGALRRERRALARVREDRIRDLGGLVLEMVRRGRFRQDLLFEQCREVLVLEDRIGEIEAILARAAAARRRRPGAHCECGAPLAWGTHFCANCGRPGGEAVVTCARCGAALPADARFCSSCGSVAGQTAGPEHVSATYEQTAAGEQFWREVEGEEDP
ncbi:MAG: zinc ribbon domain-containing protein [Gaiellaceae bacterium]